MIYREHNEVFVTINTEHGGKPFSFMVARNGGILIVSVLDYSETHVIMSLSNMEGTVPFAVKMIKPLSFYNGWYKHQLPQFAVTAITETRDLGEEMFGLKLQLNACNEAKEEYRKELFELQRENEALERKVSEQQEWGSALKLDLDKALSEIDRANEDFEKVYKSL